MDFKNALISSACEIFSGYGNKPEFQGEIEETQLSSANQVNILIGLSGGLKGNIVVGFKKSYAYKLVSKMTGGMEVSELNDFFKGALGEAINMLSGNALVKLNSPSVINLSPPTIVTGERIFIIISRVKSNKLTFKAGDEMFNIAFCLE
jgi:chemotaxis protein CheX